jgi:CubicO group peptidase (beta-lactamase class C family)
MTRTSAGIRRGAGRLCLLACIAGLAASTTQQAQSAAPELAVALSELEQRSADAGSDALLLMRGDEVVLERHGREGDRAIELMSVTKSVVAMAVGCLLQEGKLDSLDAPIHRWYPEWKQGRKQQISLRMLMDHSSGLQNDPRAHAEVYPAPDGVQLALAAELDSAPGERFAYNNKATNLIAGVVERAAGEPLDVLAQRCLFAPLGIRDVVWERDPAGHPRVMAGLSMRARDLAALGRLLLDDGLHRDQRLLPPGYAAQLFAASKASSESGLLWWRVPAYLRYHVDPAHRQQAITRGAPAELVNALAPLDGRSFDSQAALMQALSDTLGADWQTRWAQGLRASGLGPAALFRVEVGPIVGYAADGYLGQSLVLVPEVGLVAVRQIVSRPDHSEAQNFADFRGRVLTVAQALRTSQ